MKRTSTVYRDDQLTIKLDDIEGMDRQFVQVLWPHCAPSPGQAVWSDRVFRSSIPSWSCHAIVSSFPSYVSNLFVTTSTSCSRALGAAGCGSVTMMCN